MARKRVRYRMNNKSFGQFIMSDQAMKPTVEVTKAMKRRAVAISPESHDGEGVPYKDSFVVKPKPRGLVAGKYRNRRVAVELVNTAGHAPQVEYGIHNPDNNEAREGERVMLRAGLIMSPNRPGGGW